ncbi:glycosyltransferase family 39 protein [Lichenicola cladoniae]|uniref:Glycosyltransferase family 39 protein n=1 Tax=Lichenicola cladoniae TaxID=1484109 RepID=A0A6M8HV45_9PROT|nr:glycosyltransferase family 39 protein [Lichenicola cladoniae]NPD66178.1 glycosyltransferase family 39 protein [Acetobacteraceae bacterium]QKE92041.1 glycosyltransferase family 39 protein [Lichenicola cladoniae]
MNLTARHYALVAVFVLALFLPGRASLPPLDRDEPRYLEATAQMLRSHDFVDVRFQDQPRYLQPAGIYWLEAAAVAATGTLEQREVWAYRIPTLIAVIISVLLTARLGTALFGIRTGLTGALLLGVSVLMTAEGRMATIDSCLLAAILALQTALLRAWSDRDETRSTPPGIAVLYWAALGIGLMLKGPVMLIPALATPAALALVERRIDWWHRLRPAWGVPLTLAIVLPWCIAIALVSHGLFFKSAVGTNFLGKVASGQQSHGLPPGYHLVIFAIAFWPGSLFAAMAIPFVWMRRHTPQVRFLLCWIVPHWLVFELIATKLPHYVLPTYPAIALLAAASVTQAGGWRPPAALWGRIALAVYGLLWLALGTALTIAGPVLLWRLQHQWLPAAALIPVLSLPLVLLSGWLVVRGRLQDAVMSVAGGAVVVYFGLFWVVLPHLTSIWLSPRIAETVDLVRPCPTSVLASASFSEPSLVFLVGQQTRLVNAAGAADFLESDRSCGLALIGTRDEAAFRARLATHDIAVRQLALIGGINYSTGKHLDLKLFKVER